MKAENAVRLSDNLVGVEVNTIQDVVKERMAEEENAILDFYKEEYPDNYEVTEVKEESSWCCSSKDSPMYDELLITEKIVDED